MLKKLSIAALLVLGACATRPVAVAPPLPEISNDTLIAMAAICGADAAVGKTSDQKLGLSDGMGTGGFKVDSTVPDAQTWFDFSLALSHSFYHEDAKLAMKRATAADPSCSLCAFGEAFVLGPTLNYRIDDTQRQAALKAAERAKATVKPGDVKAQRLADAVIARYQKSATSTEPAFGKALADIAASYPEDIELSVLAAHSLLIPVRANDRSGLKPALAILEKVLSARPNDTGAIHYYIHATEFDGRAKDALPYAQRLGALAPKASHLVHMPAHTFFRAGLYHQAAVANAKAIGADSEWLGKGGFLPLTKVPMYYAHNLGFGLAGALMSGDEGLALKYADHAPRVWPLKEGAAAGGVVAQSWVALALYAPERVFAIPEQPKGTRQATLRAYARGEAFVRKGDLAGARAELAVLAEGKGALEEVAHGVIAGRIAMAQGDPAKAASLFAAAAQVQESKLGDYWDPPTWWYPVRRSAAAAYLAAGDARKAAEQAQKSLSVWEHDPLALKVLAEAEAKLGKAETSQAHLAEARRLWRGDLARIEAKAV